MTHNVMIDIETMGTGPRSAISSIGAVFFDPLGDDILTCFYQTVDLRSSVASGLVIDADTVIWWMKQPESARNALTREDGTSLNFALYNLRSFLLGTRLDFDVDDLIVWANGTSFDFPILSEAYRLTGIEAPWKFYNERDWRTVRKLFPEITLERTGTHHDALDDAIHQARHLQLIMLHHFALTATATEAV